MTVLLKSLTTWIAANSGSPPAFVVGTNFFLGYIQKTASFPCTVIIPITGGSKSSSGMMDIGIQLTTLSEEWEPGWTMQQNIVDILDGQDMTLSEWIVVRINLDFLPQVLEKTEDGKWMFTSTYKVFAYK
jgi:hypothetical protein